MNLVMGWSPIAFVGGLALVPPWAARTGGGRSSRSGRRQRGLALAWTPSAVEETSSGRIAAICHREIPM